MIKSTQISNWSICPAVSLDSSARHHQCRQRAHSPSQHQMLRPGARDDSPAPAGPAGLGQQGRRDAHCSRRATQSCAPFLPGLARQQVHKWPVPKRPMLLSEAYTASRVPRIFHVCEQRFICFFEASLRCWKTNVPICALIARSRHQRCKTFRAPIRT